MKNSQYFENILGAERVPRWGGYVATIDDNIAKHVARCTIYLSIIMELEENVGGHAISEKTKQNAILTMMSRGLMAPITGDIKKLTKKALGELFKEAEIDNADKLVNGFSKSIRPFFKKSVNGYYKNSYIKNLIKATKDLDNYLFCYREVEVFHNDQLRNEYMNTYKDVSVWADKMVSIKILLEDIEKEGAYFKLFRSIQDMDMVKRWNIPTLIPDNDLIHAFRTASIAIFLGSLDRYKFKKKVNFYDLTLKCLLHDLQETIGGDIVLPIKYHSEEIKKALHAFEDEIAGKIIETIPDSSVITLLEKVFLNAKEDTYEGNLCDLCDKLDALLHSVVEKNVCNKNFDSIYSINLTMMQQSYTNESLTYFFSYILYDLIK